ncbi:MAG: type II toxin-antitoxin system HicB family antitoxin [bacterium]
MNKYEVIIYWSEDDDTFVAEVPELPGCIARGAKQVDALLNAQEAVRVWLDAAEETGDPIPLPGARRVRRT